MGPDSPTSCGAMFEENSSTEGEDWERVTMVLVVLRLSEQASLATT